MHTPSVFIKYNWPIRNMLRVVRVAFGPINREWTCRTRPTDSGVLYLSYDYYYMLKTSVSASRRHFKINYISLSTALPNCANSPSTCVVRVRDPRVQPFIGRPGQTCNEK